MTAKYLKFWGTRGSTPVSGPQYVEFGGNTSCLEIRYGEHLLIIDAGTGIRPLGTTLKGPQTIHLLFSHSHWDHIIGLPFFAPLYRNDVTIHLYSPKGSLPIQKRLDTLFAEDFFPIPFSKVKAKIHHHTIPLPSLQIGPVHISCHRTHHPSETYCFKIKTPHETIGYVSDNEVNIAEQKSFIDFHRHVDYFVHETQYTKEEYQKKSGWGHSSVSAVIDLVEQVAPKNWFVTHHDPEHSDEALRALSLAARHLLEKRSLTIPVRFLHDGQILSLK